MIKNVKARRLNLSLTIKPPHCGFKFPDGLFSKSFGLSFYFYKKSQHGGSIATLVTTKIKNKATEAMVRQTTTVFGRIRVCILNVCEREGHIPLHGHFITNEVYKSAANCV